ncbi:MAG: hypothetical protein CM15mP84_05030 [Cellvibrionales bacterium]|nr:MAG: hypothetical protein CM15mP84_05030 [Cellvibrionales bacterium]
MVGGAGNPRTKYPKSRGPQPPLSAGDAGVNLDPGVADFSRFPPGTTLGF